MKTAKRELPIPSPAQHDERAVEFIRAWTAHKALHCSLNVGTWHDSGRFDERHAWGMLLADVARHVSGALEQRYGIDQRESILQIRDAFTAEIDHPTSPVRGSFEEHSKQ